MKKTFMFIAALFAALFAQAQEFDGSWSGELNVGGLSLPLTFHISGSKATMDSPKQGAMGIELSPVEYSDGKVTLKSDPMQMTFTGTLSDDSHISGTFSQAGFNLPLNLERSEKSGPDRPQEPQPPFPYRTEEVEFTSAAGDVTLHGTLTIPDDGQRHPAAVLVTGSGTQNRDEELFGHKPFKVIADYLTRRGIVVLRYDDREFATGTYDGATTRDYAADALGALAFLRSRPEADTARMGVIGHSEGGTIAFICAAEEPQTEFIVSLAGMTVTGAECLVDQNRLVLNQAALINSGVSAAMVDEICGFVGSVFAGTKGLSAAQIREQAGEIIDRAAAAAAHPQYIAPVRDAMVQTLAEMNEWTAYFIDYDPAESIGRVGCRVLALNGTKDMQVSAEANLGRLEQFDNLSGRLTTRRLEGLNHLFQHCATGSPMEYAQIEETFSAEVLEAIADWILAGE